MTKIIGSYSSTGGSVTSSVFYFSPCFSTLYSIFTNKMCRVGVCVSVFVYVLLFVAFDVFFFYFALVCVCCLNLRSYTVDF